MRKTYGFGLSVVLASAIAISGCSGSGGASETASPVGSASPKAAEKVTPEGQFPITAEKTTVKIMTRSNASVKDFATNAFTKYLEEKTNVHIEWDIVPDKSYQEKLNLVLASGDLPDVIMSMWVTPAQQMIYGSQGLFIPLNGFIEKYGKETKRMFKELPIVKDSITAPDGNIYALPAPNECYHCSMSQKLWIYKPWLDKLGLKVPTTTDEFYEVLKAFKTKDPNGNGKADEIPLSGSSKGWNTSIDSFLMNAFTYNPAGKLYVDNGKVVPAFNKPEWKEGLQYLRKLYAEGLLDPQSVLQDTNQLKKLGENPSAPILGASSAGWMGEFTEASGPSGRWKEYVTVPPLKGPKGLQVAPYQPYEVNGGLFVITKAAKNPEVAFRLADALYDQEMTLRSIIGEKDKDWKWADKGELGINGKQAIWKQLSKLGDVQNSHWGQTGISLRTNEHRLGEVNDPNNSIEPLLYKETNTNYDPYKQDVKKVLPPLFYTNEQSAELAVLNKTINDFVNEMIVRFVTNDANLDKDWDAYLKNLESMNLAKFLSIHQQAYDAKMKK